MGYIVVQRYNKANDTCLCDIITDDLMTIENQFVYPKSTLGNYVKTNKLVPLNFSVDRNGTVVEDYGIFSRFDSPLCAIVLAELRTQSRRVLGYRLLGCSNGVMTNMKTEEILKLGLSVNYPILQNAIIRNNVINCYKLHQFPTITIGVHNHGKRPKLVEDKPKAKQVVKEFTEAQLKELERCRKSGISSKFIENPNLSPEQMRVLWVSATKGALAYLYSNPAYSREVMVFYADRLVDAKIANDCILMLSHPELSLDKLAELYLCVCKGIDYSDLLDKSAVDIMVARKQREEELWGNPFEEAGSKSMLDKALAYAERVRTNRGV